MKRFIKEYANYQKAYFTSNDMILPEYKKKALETINGAVRAIERNLITVNEAMRIISDPLA